MMDAIAYKSEIPTADKSDDSTGAGMKSENEKPICSTEATAEKDSLRYITKLIDNIEALNRDLNPQILNKEQGLSQEPRQEEKK